MKETSLRTPRTSITFNGTAAATAAADLLQLVAELTDRQLDSTGRPVDGARLGVAVAVNAAVVPRSEWAGRKLSDGDDIELVTAVQGG